MSLIESIRNFSEVLNNNSHLLEKDIPFQKLIEITFIFFLQNIKFVIFNILSFQWVRELNQLPIIIPKLSESVLRENFFLENFDSIYTIFDTHSLNTNKFFTGFLNGFFLSLPFSCSQLISIRYLLVQGRIAAIFSCLGNVLGQIFFIGTVLLGIRGIIIPFFSFEPFIYIGGVILLIHIVYNIVHEKSKKRIDLTNKKKLIKIFFYNFFLIWTEQSCIYQYFSNISVGTEPTILETFFASNNFNFLLVHILYLIGLLLGCIFFNFVFCYIIENISEFLQLRLNVLKSSWILGTNFFLLSSILGLTFSSIPYYAIDYLLTSPLGFISQDKAFKNTIFSQNNIADSIGELGQMSLRTDVANFDKGFYLNPPTYENFEQLNYSGEYATFIHQGNLSLSQNYKERIKKIRNLITGKEDTIKENLDSKIKKTRSLEDKNFNNFFKYPTFFLVGKDFSPSIYLERRFENLYKDEANNTTFSFLVEKSLNFLFFKDVYPQSEIDKKIKQNFYSNSVYKFLLNIDIDTFLNRQKYKININQEKKLHEKRLMLTRYHDTLRFYNILPYSEEFQFFFNGTKSFADRVYNQQFKGTLQIVRRLFSISFFSKENDSEKLILKYDQPLFSSNPSKKLIFHEELTEKNIHKKPFIELMNQSPFYIGWDDNLKKIILTNRVLPKKTAIFENINSDKEKNIKFTMWPIEEKNLQLKNKVLFRTSDPMKDKDFNAEPLFSYNDTQTGFSFYTNLPSSINNLEASGFDIFPPNRGGFIWPGSYFEKKFDK